MATSTRAGGSSAACRKGAAHDGHQRKIAHLGEGERYQQHQWRCENAASITSASGTVHRRWPSPCPASIPACQSACMTTALRGKSVLPTRRSSPPSKRQQPPWPFFHFFTHQQGRGYPSACVLALTCPHQSVGRALLVYIQPAAMALSGRHANMHLPPPPPPRTRL